MITPVSVGPRHGVQPSANTAPSSGAPATVANCRGLNRAWRCSAGMRPDEHQAHDDGQHAADPLQQKLVGDQRGGHAQHRDGAEHEHRGEPGNEQRRRPGDPPARGGRRLDGRRRPSRPARPHRRRPPPPDTTGSRAPAAPRTARRTTPARPAGTRPAPPAVARRRRSGRIRSLWSRRRLCGGAQRPPAAPPAAGPRPAVRAGTPRPPGAARSSTRVDGMTVVGYLPPNAIMVRIGRVVDRRERHLAVVDEVLGRLAVVVADVDAEERHAETAGRVVHLLQLGDLGPAGPAPLAPDVDDDDLARQSRSARWSSPGPPGSGPDSGPGRPRLAGGS